MDERFWSQVKKTDGCWLWAGRVIDGRYGIYRYASPDRQMAAHRWAWLDSGRALDPALVLDHLCNNGLCVRPAHLRLCTQQENVRRGGTGKINNHNARKTRCPLGHAYSRAADGHRVCRTCKQMHNAGTHPRQGTRPR